MVEKIDNFLKQMISWCIKKIRKKEDEQLACSLVQFVKFCIVGLSNTAISYILNVILLLVLRPFSIKWDYVIANTVSFMISILWSFLWNYKCVFSVKKTKKIGGMLVKTFVAYSFTGIFLNNALSYVWITVLSVSKYLAPLINLIVSVPINFIINKFWAFK